MLTSSMLILLLKLFLKNNCAKLDIKNVKFHLKICIKFDITNVDKLYPYFATKLFFKILRKT